MGTIFIITTEYNGDKKTVCRGVLDGNGVPNGKFELLSVDDRFKAKGKYRNGIKDGEWSISLDGKSNLISWSKINYEKFTFALPSHWQVWTDSISNGLVVLNQDTSGNMLNELRLQSYPVGQLNMSFVQLEQTYFERMETQFMKKTVDYSEAYIDNYNVDKMAFRQYVMSDVAGKEGIVYLLIFMINENELGEMTYMAPRNNIDFDSYLFNEIFLDLNYASRPVFDRWQLNLLN